MSLNLVLRFSFIIIIIPHLISACGGGSGSNSSNEPIIDIPFTLDSTPDGVGVNYQGHRGPALLTTDLALKFLEVIYADSSSDNIDLELPSENAITVSGYVSGSLKITGNLDKKNDVLTATWSNYSNHVDRLVNGKIIYKVVEIDKINQIIKVIVILNDLQTITPQYSLVSNGNIFIKQDYNHNIDTTVLDINIYEENSGTWYAYDKFKIIENNLDIQTTELTGRFYQGDAGYIDISTIDPLRECSLCQQAPHPVTGSLRFNGTHESQVTFKFIEDDYSVPKGTMNLVTSNQDQVGPVQSSYNWRHMETWKSENNAPRLRVYFLNHTDGDGSFKQLEVNVYSSDQDRDNIELSYTWFVNDLEVSNDYIHPNMGNPSFNEKILPNYYFKAGDTIKVKVTADDGFYTEKEVSQIVTAPEIYNVTPTIVLTNGIISSFYYVDYYVTSHEGDTGVLDASNSYDGDGDSLEFKWTQNNNDQELIIHNPNSAKTTVTCGSYYGCNNLCFYLKVTETRNGEQINVFGNDNLNICYTD